jgi:hypothetical protein
MSLFPASPANGQQVTVNGIVYTYYSDQTAWVRTTSTVNTDLVTSFTVVNQATSTVVTGAIANANTTMSVHYFRTIQIGTAGNINPVYTMSASAGAYTTLVGSYFKLTPIGNATGNTNVGNWT